MEKLIKSSSIIFENEEVEIYLNIETNLYEFFVAENNGLKPVSTDKKDKLDSIYNYNDGKIRGNSFNKIIQEQKKEQEFEEVQLKLTNKIGKETEVKIYLSKEMMDYKWFIEDCLAKFAKENFGDAAFGEKFDTNLLNDLHIKFDRTCNYDYFDIIDKSVNFQDEAFYEETFNHELMHYLANKISQTNERNGFETIEKIGYLFHNSLTGINEGATDYYSYGDKESYYSELRYFYSVLTKVVGEDKMKNYYANSMPEQMIKDLSEKTGLSYTENYIILSNLDVLNNSIKTYENITMSKKAKENFYKMFAESFSNFARIYFNYLLKNNPKQIEKESFESFFPDFHRNIIKDNKNFYNEKLLKEKFNNLKEIFEKKANRIIRQEEDKDLKQQEEKCF